VSDLHDDVREPELVDVRDAAAAREALERLGRDTWREALDWLERHAAARPVAPDRYPHLRRAYYGPGGMPGPAPQAGAPIAEVLAGFRDRLAPHLYNAHHPRQWGFFTPPALPVAIAGEVLAAWTNQGIDLWLSGMAGPFVEEEVIRWMCDLVGYDEAGFGVLTSGGVMANLMALAVARDAGLARALGAGEPPRAGDLEGVRVYASDQAHFSIERALDLLGFPPGTLRVLPSDDRYRLTPEAAAAAIAEDRAAGLTPWAIAAAAGSTNTGSVDDVPALADLAAREGLWLHVDAAYGGAARLSPRLAERVPGLERADSITVDPHKWFFQPYDIGGLLVRRRADLASTFHRSPEYYRDVLPDAEPLHWYRHSIEGTRRFRALKLWLTWHHLGTHGLAALVERTVSTAVLLVERLRAAGGFEIEPGEPDLSVVCFRHVPPELRADRLDDHQDRLQRALEVDGTGWVSTTRLRGRTFLRAGVLNYLTTPQDVDAVVSALLRLSEGVLEDLDAS
jgi:glutamate/tyrosine decarboxylase-like PLP-dependent enzyme